MTVRERLAANIRETRKGLHFTQEQLAEQAEVSYQMVHDIEGCRTWVSDKTLERLATALRVDIHELLLPPTGEGDGAAGPGAFPPRLVERLREAMKADVDRRLDEFLGGASANPGLPGAPPGAA